MPLATDDVVDGDRGLHDGGVEVVVGQWAGGGYVAVAEVCGGLCARGCTRGILYRYSWFEPDGGQGWGEDVVGLVRLRGIWCGSVGEGENGAHVLPCNDLGRIATFDFP